VVETAAAAGVPLSGENALQRYDHFAFDRIAESAFGHQARAGCLESLTFLRMGEAAYLACTRTVRLATAHSQAS
jgi:beta-amylase